MKVRIGFVSNSSSSSYVAVITRDKEVIEKFMDKCCAGDDALDDLCEGCNEDFTEISYSIMEHKTTGIQANAEYGEVYWVGLEITELLKKDMKLSECKQKVSDMFASIGIDISPDKLYFDCDVCSSG